MVLEPVLFAFLALKMVLALLSGSGWIHSPFKQRTSHTSLTDHFCVDEQVQRAYQVVREVFPY